MGFVLAVGILMTGPGLCALDHIIWPGRGSAPDTGLAEAQQAG